MKSMKLPSVPKAESNVTATVDVSGRRSFLRSLGLGALGAGLAGQLIAMVRALVPNVLYEPPRALQHGGLPQDFAEGMTYVEDHRLFIGRDRRG